MDNTNKTSKDFEKIYINKVKPLLNNLENFRLKEREKIDKYRKTLWMTFATAMIGFPLVAIIQTFIKISNDIMLIGFLIFFFIFAFSILRSNKISKDYRTKIKALLLKPILLTFGDFQLYNKEVITLKEIKSYGLFYRSKKKSDDDTIVGFYKNIPISLVDTKLTHSSNRENSSTIVDFNGLIIKVKMNKNFENITIGHQKFDTNNSVYITDHKTPKNLEKITLEDCEFNNIYNIYSKSQIESRYLLTPTFMEKIKIIQSEFPAVSLNFVFDKKYLYLFLNTSHFNIVKGDNGLFEISNIDESLLNKEKYFILYNQLITIFSLIDYLKLNQKIGL